MRYWPCPRCKVQYQLSRGLTFNSVCEVPGCKLRFRTVEPSGSPKLRMLTDEEEVLRKGWDLADVREVDDPSQL